MKIFASLFLITLFPNFLFAQKEDTTRINVEEFEKEVLKAKKELAPIKDSQPFGKGESLGFGGYDFSNINGKDYSEVAKANNWNSFSLPENIDEQYDEYYRNKDIKLILIVILSLAFLIFIIYALRKRKILENDTDELKLKLDRKNNDLDNLLKLELINKEEHLEKQKSFLQDYNQEKETQSKILNKNLKLKKIKEAYENGIFSQKEYEEKLKDLD